MDLGRVVGVRGLGGDLDLEEALDDALVEAREALEVGLDWIGLATHKIWSGFSIFNQRNEKEPKIQQECQECYPDASSALFRKSRVAYTFQRFKVTS